MRSNSEIVDMIVSLYKSKGWSLSEFSRKINIPKSSLSRYFNKNRQFPINKVDIFASILGVRSEEILGINSPEAQLAPLSHVSDKVIHLDRHLREPRHSAWISHGESLLTEQDNENTIAEPIALYDDRERVTGIVDFAASAGTGVWQDENLGMEVTFYKDDMAEDYDSIGIVMGHSMEPVLKNGDYLFVKVTTDIPNGAISIWQINGENYVKKFRSNGKAYLESLNPEYDDIILDDQDDIRPLAIVVDVYREG